MPTLAVRGGRIELVVYVRRMGLLRSRVLVYVTKVHAIVLCMCMEALKYGEVMVLELLLCVSFIFPGHRNLLLSIALPRVPASHIT